MTISKVNIKAIKEEKKRQFAVVKDKGVTRNRIPVIQVFGVVHKADPSKTYIGWMNESGGAQEILALETRDYPDLSVGDTVYFLDKNTYMIFKKITGGVTIKNKDGNTFIMENGEVALKESDQVYIKIDKDKKLSVKCGPGGSFDLYEYNRDVLSALNGFQVNVNTTIAGTSPSGPVTGTGSGTGTIATNSASDVAALNVKLNEGMKRGD